MRDACSRTDLLSVPESARSVALAVRCWTRAGWRWGTGRPRLAIAHWAVKPRPQPTRLGMICSLLGESAWRVCTTAELSASCLDPMAMCLSPFPVLLRIGLLVRLYCCVACLLAERHLSIPERLKRLALAVLYGALGARSAVCAQAHLTEDGLSPGCSARVARTDEQHRWLLRTMGCLGCYLSRIS